LATKELALASQQRTISHCLFHQGIFDQNNMTAAPHPLHFSLFPRLKRKAKGSHFDTTEVVESESQAVLNTLTEHDFQDACRKWQKHGNGAYARKGTTSRVMAQS
jgi:hypothetical protein